MTTELRLLTEVSYRGREITGPRLHGLLALLADDLRAGRTSARLVADLWPETDERPEHPKKALQVLVSRVRSQLGPGLVVSTPTGYRLALDEQQVDTSAVLLSAAESARHARAGDHITALQHAEAGLARWERDSGEGAPETGAGDPLTELRRRRAATHRSLVRARALALSRLGRRTDAVAPLTGVLRDRPRDEEVLLELLRCEASASGPAQALATYDTYRRALREELGTEPGAPLRAAYQELLRSQAPVLRQGVAHDPNALLGRDDDLTTVTELLRTSRVTSIVGAGGLGKTRLAHAVSRVAEQRAVYFVPLAGVGTDGDVAGEVASVLSVREARRATRAGPTAPADVLGLIVSALGPGPVLLVLDNCEHVVRGAAELVRGLVSMTRDLRVLTTSRAPLGLSSESVYGLPQLDLPTSVELFERRARAARPDAELAPDAMAEVCRQLDGLPLAVELAAARVRVMSVPAIARRLGDRFTLLRGGARDAPPRHRTLHAVVEWSWNLLDPAGQAALRALSVFPGGFTEEAAHALLEQDPEAYDTLRVLEDLVDQSLLRVVDTRPGARFHMLETVREFGAARLEAAGGTASVTAAFLAWARDFGTAHHGPLLGAEPIVSGELIKAEQDNLLRALRLGLAQGDGATVAATSAVLGGVWLVESAYARMAVLNDETAWRLSHYRPEPDAVEITRTALTVCTAYGLVTGGPRASRALVALRRLPTAPPDTLIRATALALTGGPGAGPQKDGAAPLLTAVTSAFDSFVRESEGDLPGALAAAGRMLDASDVAAVPWVWIIAHARVGELSARSGRIEQERSHYEAMLPVLEGLNARPDVVGVHAALALIGLQLGDVDDAERQLDLATRYPADDEAAMTFGLGTDAESGHAFDHAVRGEIALARGQTETGLSLWRTAVEQVTQLSSRSLIAEHSLDLWAVEIDTAAVMAHAQHGRLDLVAEATGELRHSLTKALASPLVSSPMSRLELPACGALLLALATVDLAAVEESTDGGTGVRRSAARLIALAERFRLLRNFQPTMSPARARRTAERADATEYARAAAEYAALPHEDLRAAALDALRQRDASAPTATHRAAGSRL